MQQSVKEIIANFISLSLGALLIVFASTYLFAEQQLFVVVLGYLLSFVFVASNLYVIKNIDGEASKAFYRKFYISLSLRFVLVVIALVGVLMIIKIHQIHFTVSFIISYIFHSVIEIISINKILETD